MLLGAKVPYLSLAGFSIRQYYASTADGSGLNKKVIGDYDSLKGLLLAVDGRLPAWECS